MAIRYPRGSGHMRQWECPLEPIAVGKGECLTEGSDVAVISIGPIASEVSKAIKAVNADGISVAHYDMIFLKPIDNGLLKSVASMDCPIITVEDGTVNGGLGSAVIEWLSDNGLERRVSRIGIPDRFIPQGTVPQLYKMCGMDAASIADVIRSVVKS